MLLILLEFYCSNRIHICRYRARLLKWERSLNLRSTAHQRLIFLHSSLIPAPPLCPHCPHSLQTTDSLRVPLPSPEGCGPSSFSLNGWIWEGGTRGGTQEVGGPCGASGKRAMTKVVARLYPSLFHTGRC